MSLASRRLDASFVRRLGARAPARAGALIGLEHEFRLAFEGASVDFRTLLPNLTLAGVRVDPADPEALRTPSGLAVTADEREAEIATPPIEVVPGFTRRLAAWAAEGRRTLREALPAGVSLDGYSTHLSVSMPDAENERACAELAWTFAPALMLLMDRPDSPGLMIRPRHGRTELGGEFVDGVRLRAAAAFAAGAVRASLGNHGLPRLRAAIIPTGQRYGWYAARDAFGPDLYSDGRDALLTTEDGVVITAGELLARAWAVAREALGADADEADLEAADAVVEGRIPLPVEDPSWRSPAAATEDTPADHALGRVVRARIRPGLELTPAWATWDFTVLEVRGARPVYAAIPAAASRTFLDQLERGRLDDLLRRYAASSGGDRILESAEQAARGGLYDRVGEPQTLVPAERTPLFGGPKDKLRRRRDDRDQDRREDQQRQDQGGQGAERPRGQHAGRRWPRGRLGMAVVAGLVAVAVVTTAVVLASRNKKEGPGGQGATTPPVNLAALPLADARLQGEFDAGAPSTVSFEPSCAKGACGGTWHTGNAIAPGEFVPVDAPFTKGDGAYASTTDGPGFCASPDNQKVIRRGAHSIGTYTLTVVGTGVIDGVLRATAVTIAGSETVTPVGPGKAANCTASTFASSATWTLVGETPDPPSAASPDPEAYRAWGSHWSGPFNGYANASVGLLQALQSGQGAGFVAIAAQQVAGQLPGLITAATTAPSPPSAYAAQIQTLLSALAEEAPYAKALENECATQDPDRCSAAAQQWFARGQATLDALGGLPVAPKEIEPSPTP